MKRQKNDAKDAEAAVRPKIRFAPVKSAKQQSRSMVFKTRDLFVRQRNSIINALRGHLMEYGIIADPGQNSVKKLAEQIESPDCNPPSIVIDLSRVHLDQLSTFTDKTVVREQRLKDETKTDPETNRLQTAPSIGPVSAMTIKAFAPPLKGFKRGRDFAAWLGLVPVQKSTGGRHILGRTARYQAIAEYWGHDEDQMLERRPRLLAAITLADKTARTIWAMMTKQQDHRDPVAAA
ncbi:transposase [Falsihalocynthiibacter sp. S25ZX9]|uniref:transposase n=1 Tax=Falsihalocynthiibacter sp. S25ZX9 TaxID=3240870 RepID=UPI00350EAD74